LRISHLLVIAVLAAICSSAEAASFDCSKATRAVDKMICADPELSRSDADLAQAYKAALAVAHSDQDRATLRNSQRVWLAKRDARCLRMVPAAAADCLQDEYAARLAQLRSCNANAAAACPVVHVVGVPAPPVAGARIFALNDGALSAAYPTLRGALEFPQGAFSGGQDLFAFGVSQIVSGDIDQIWIYSLSDKRLVPATPSPVRDKIDVSIQGFDWGGDTLYVTGTSGPHGGAQEAFSLAATMNGYKKIDVIPPHGVGPEMARDTTAAAGDELSDQGDKREENSHFVITSKNQGHGALTLTAHDKSSKRDFTIATGTWNLESFVFDALRGRVIYANADGGIDIYSLASRQTVATIAVPINVLLDVSEDGTLAAFSGNGRCDPAAPAADGGRRQVICFVKLPV
jgi:uncharacterized protein